MKKFTFTITKESNEAYTVYWKETVVYTVRQEDYDSGERSKDFLTEKEAREYAATLLHKETLVGEPWCMYRRVVDLTKPAVAYRGAEQFISKFGIEEN